MKSLPFSCALFLFAVGNLHGEDAASAATSPASAASPTASTAENNPAAELGDLVKKIMTKLRAGERTADALKAELAEFDALIAKYKDDRSEAVADIHFKRATLYLQVLDDSEKGRAMLEQIKTDFPGTRIAANVDRTLASIDRAAKAKATSETLAGKPAPELNFKWSTREGLKRLSDLKGKVVVLDFWATWCGPCISSFPQIREITEHYKDMDVVVLGVTSIQGSVANLARGRVDTKGDPEKEMSLMHEFIKEKKVTWDIVFSEEPVFNEAYGIVGIPHMAIVAPDGTVRHNGLHPGGVPHEEKVKMIDALLKEFGKPILASTPNK